MPIIIGIIFIIIGTALVWFNIPYSPIKNQFKKDANALISKNLPKESMGVFKENDFSNLPIAIRQYIENCGYIGTPKMHYLKMMYHDVDFRQARNGRALTIDYMQYNFVADQSRIALINSQMFGIPFEGYDSYQNGKGVMKGILAKMITLFNQTGKEMDKACLVTFLAECLFAPAILLQEYLVMEEINEYEVRATISYLDIIVSGIFTFNEQYEMIKFTTNDRSAIGTDGTIESIPWSALCSDYRINNNGIKSPTTFQAVWNYSDGDFVYFDGKISEIMYDY